MNMLNSCWCSELQSDLNCRPSAHRFLKVGRSAPSLPSAALMSPVRAEICTFLMILWLFMVSSSSVAVSNSVPARLWHSSDYLWPHATFFMAHLCFFSMQSGLFLESSRLSETRLWTSQSVRNQTGNRFAFLADYRMCCCRTTSENSACLRLRLAPLAFLQEEFVLWSRSNWKSFFPSQIIKML